MGRKKIPIRTRRGRQQQQLTYNKRKDGLAKKARELAILCDIEVLLLTFSPKDQPLLVLGPTTQFDEIINKYNAAGPSAREKSRNENVKALCNAFKSDKDMKEADLQQLLKLPRPDALIEELAQDIRDELGPLSAVDRLHMINDVKELEAIEKELKALLQYTRCLQDMQKLRESGCQPYPHQETMSVDPTQMQTQIPHQISMDTGGGSSSMAAVAAEATAGYQEVGIHHDSIMAAEAEADIDWIDSSFNISLD